MGMSPLAMKDDLNMAFIRSQMSRDARPWLIATKDEDETSTNLACHPQSVILDFCIALSDIHQRLTQRMFIHNQSGRDLSVRVGRNITDDMVFDVLSESMQVTSGNTGELEVLLRPPTTISSSHENWNLFVDDSFTLSNAIPPQTQIVKIDVEQSADTIDFGLVTCSSHRFEKSIQLKNVLPCSVRVTAQLQAAEANRRRSYLTNLNNELDLPADSIVPFGLTLEPSDNTEEDIDADICLAIDSPKSQSARVCAPNSSHSRLSRSHHHRQLPIGSSGHR